MPGRGYAAPTDLRSTSIRISELSVTSIMNAASKVIFLNTYELVLRSHEDGLPGAGIQPVVTNNYLFS